MYVNKTPFRQNVAEYDCTFSKTVKLFCGAVVNNGMQKGSI
jgi:hypothetical protein